MAMSIQEKLNWNLSFGELIQVFQILGSIKRKGQLQDIILVGQECAFLREKYYFPPYRPPHFSRILERDLVLLELRGIVIDTGGPNSLVLTEKGKKIKIRDAWVINQDKLKTLAELNLWDLRKIALLIYTIGIERIKQKSFDQREIDFLSISQQELANLFNIIETKLCC